MRNFRKDPAERWNCDLMQVFPSSLHEIVTAASESSIFNTAKDRILLHAASSSKFGRYWDSTWFVKRAFQTALPMRTQGR